MSINDGIMHSGRFFVFVIFSRRLSGRKSTLPRARSSIPSTNGPWHRLSHRPIWSGQSNCRKGRTSRTGSPFIVSRAIPEINNRRWKMKKKHFDFKQFGNSNVKYCIPPPLCRVTFCLHSGNYTRRAVFPEMCKINQSSVDFHCEPFGWLIDWLTMS